jgi:putative ABC transport system substrate-binding protein
MPVVGWPNVASHQDYARPLSAFLDGLGEAGYVDGRNVSIEYRWAEHHEDRLPELVADLIRRGVTVIAATSTPAALAAKSGDEDNSNHLRNWRRPRPAWPRRQPQSARWERRGVTQLTVGIVPKELEMLHELLPTALVIAATRQPS